ncbi:hypothetical protein K435DRAFT_728872 [Dendrothele bispora CBS 962.96]|uniref:BTB domain-containing protein n=1 Tax=Dendrothele bispora (strain CBS 962.96) TaxID=1314807 RepID=A0A4V4HE62_DENBC|nr:hypothetical protein K435DRAFT_728872 [Dendrothele bispora CBS 962.96]
MLQKHPVYWFDDADTILHPKSSEDGNDVLFKVHPSRLTAYSPTIMSRLQAQTLSDYPKQADLETDLSSCKYVVLDGDRVADGKDLIVLLDHIYGHHTLSPAESDFQRIASLLRISSPDQLDFPELHEQTKTCFISLFPKNADQVATFQCDYAQEAAALALEYDIQTAIKPLLYHLVAQSNLDSFPIHVKKELADKIASRGNTLMENLATYFTPVIFTPPPTSHMACTDVIADKWMEFVITPVLADSGLCHPIESLEMLKGIDWVKEGICEDCVKDKRDEWTAEQSAVWDKMDDWLG